jgi:hypothetical protein
MECVRHQVHHHQVHHLVQVVLHQVAHLVALQAQAVLQVLPIHPVLDKLVIIVFSLVLLIWITEVIIMEELITVGHIINMQQEQHTFIGYPLKRHG